MRKIIKVPIVSKHILCQRVIQRIKPGQESERLVVVQRHESINVISELFFGKFVISRKLAKIIWRIIVDKAYNIDSKTV